MTQKRKTTTISFEGNRDEVKALRLLAFQQDTTVGKLVRDALQAQYPVFFTSNVSQKRQLDKKASKRHND